MFGLMKSAAGVFLFIRLKFKHYFNVTSFVLKFNQHTLTKKYDAVGHYDSGLNN